MRRFHSASALIGATKPDIPVIGLRPHAAARAARWFIDNFPGDVAYAYKANSSVFLLGALYGAGIRHFDVASLPEIDGCRDHPRRTLHFMHPVKSRTAIRRAFAEFGVRSFALDSEDELEKIMEETGGCRELTLWVRVSVAAKNSRDAAGAQVRRHRRQGGAPARQGAAGVQGARHHLPRRLADRARPRPTSPRSPRWAG